MFTAVCAVVCAGYSSGCERSVPNTGGDPAVCEEAAGTAPRKTGAGFKTALIRSFVR